MLHSGQLIRSGELSYSAGIKQWCSGAASDLSEGPYVFVVAVSNRIIHVQQAYFISYVVQNNQVVVNFGTVADNAAYFEGSTEIATDAAAGTATALLSAPFDVPANTPLICEIEDSSSTGTGSVVVEYVLGELAGEMPAVES